LSYRVQSHPAPTDKSRCVSSTLVSPYRLAGSNPITSRRVRSRLHDQSCLCHVDSYDIPIPFLSDPFHNDNPSQPTTCLITTTSLDRSTSRHTRTSPRPTDNPFHPAFFSCQVQPTRLTLSVPVLSLPAEPQRHAYSCHVTPEHNDKPRPTRPYQCLVSPPLNDKSDRAHPKRKNPRP
jgi:hypothetical protein